MTSSIHRYRSQAAGLLLAFLAVAAVSSAWARSATPPPGGQRLYDMKWLNINKWKCPFYNDGRYGIDITVGSGQAGGSWPQPLHNCYIFGAGLWFGSLKPNPNTPGKTDTLVTFGYNPNSGGTEMSPVTVEHKDDGSGSPDDRIFTYPADWPPRPRDRWVTYPELDTLVPRENFSLQDMWMAYSDALPENHISPGKPQMIDVFETVYAWNYPTNQDIFFIIYLVRNTSDVDTLKNCYMGAVCDADVGDAADDMVGTLLNNYVPGADTVKNVGYVGDNNNVENASAVWEAGTPGVLAYKFLESPRDTSGRQLGMTAFKKFTIDIDPVTDAAQYLTMAGFDYRTGVYSPYDSVLDIDPKDKRFIQCSGPFTLVPHQMVRLVVAAIGAPFGGPGQAWADRFPGGRLDSLVHLAKVANQAQFIYDQGWLLPGPPLAPNLTLIPGDNQVRLVWDNLPEKTADPYWLKVASDPTKTGWDPKYRGYDFEGYIAYKSKNGSDWEILGQCDLRGDSVAFTYPPGGDSTLPDSLWIKANDTTGIFYTLLDEDVINGFTYYYCVAAYDWNYSTTQWDSAHTTPVAWDTIILRSGLSSNFSTVPRWEAANYVAPKPKIITVYGDTVNPGFRPLPTVVVPYEVTTDTYELRFLAPTYGAAAARVIYQYFMRDARNDSLVLDTTSLGYTVGSKLTLSLPAVNGIVLDCSLNIATPSRAFDTVAVQSGGYPGNKLRPSGKADKGLWAFRGVDYELDWQTQPYLTAKVYDVTNGRVELLHSGFDGRTQTQDKANGWCFVDLAGHNPTDTLKTGTYQVYICGGYFLLNYDSTAGRGDSIGSNRDIIRDGDKWLAHGDRAARTSPAYSVYQMVSTPYVARTDTTYDLSKVIKVVPNPYIVFNAWEKSTDLRFVRFTHLPNVCTIRIYTTSGDLVKTIKHKDTNTQPLDVGGTETWDFTNESPGSSGTAISGQLIASGVYVWHVESPVGEAVGKLVFIH